MTRTDLLGLFETVKEPMLDQLWSRFDDESGSWVYDPALHLSYNDRERIDAGPSAEVARKSLRAVGNVARSALPQDYIPTSRELPHPTARLTARARGWGFLFRGRALQTPAYPQGAQSPQALIRSVPLLTAS